jgi:hypothetical protein
MDPIKLIGTSHGGKLTVDVPEELDDKEIEIMIISSKEKNKDDDQNKAETRNIKELSSIADPAKDDAYDQ